MKHIWAERNAQCLQLFYSTHIMQGDTTTFVRLSCVAGVNLYIKVTIDLRDSRGPFTNCSMKLFLQRVIHRKVKNKPQTYISHSSGLKVREKKEKYQTTHDIVPIWTQKFLSKNHQKLLLNIKLWKCFCKYCQNYYFHWYLPLSMFRICLL